MKLTYLLTLASLFNPVLSFAQAVDPFKEGISPITISQSERDELNSYLNSQETRLKRVIRLAQVTYPGNSARKIDMRIAMYRDELKKIIPESALDLQNQSATLLRISLNQGMFLDESMQNESYFTHDFREAAMLNAINGAIEFYQNDIELFQNKRKLEEEYVRYAVHFSTFVLNNYEMLCKQESALFFREASQLILNVLLAKGNTLRNLFAAEINTLEDIIAKTDPSYTLIDSNRLKTKYASQSFREMYISLSAKWNTYDQALQKKHMDEQQNLYNQRKTEKTEAYFSNPQYQNSILVRDFVNGPRAPKAFDKHFFHYLSPDNHEERNGVLLCSSDPTIRSAIYLQDYAHGREPFAYFENDADCFALYKDSAQDNINGYGYSNSGISPNEAFIVMLKKEPGKSTVIQEMRPY